MTIKKINAATAVASGKVQTFFNKDEITLKYNGGEDVFRGDAIVIHAEMSSDETKETYAKYLKVLMGVQSGDESLRDELERLQNKLTQLCHEEGEISDEKIENLKIQKEVDDVVDVESLDAEFFG